MSKQYYITTPLYYVNSPLTVGGAYTTIIADVLARYQRLRGREVFFLTGSDEHGQKISRAAREKGISPKKLADNVVGSFIELWDRLGITNNDFIRTTQPRHEEVAVKVFQRLYKQGDIYRGKYQGWYCTPCETFLRESQLVDGCCPSCNRPVEKLVEENYFFRLSRYQKPLEEHFNAHPDFVRPPSRFREMDNRLQEGLNDISVSRSVEWGIPIPGWPGQTVWVWFDALLNYISAIAPFSPDSSFGDIWPADLHLMAKDILWFHSILWPAMLLALDLPLPRRVFAHGWWTMGGKKISKSETTTFYARDIIEEWGVDALRYFLLREVTIQPDGNFLLREVPIGLDGNFSTAAIGNRYRCDLANDLGNLLQRTLGLISKYRDGRIPAPGPGTDSILNEVGALWPRYHSMMEEMELNQVLEEVWTMVNRANRYIEENKPWRLSKEKGGDEKLSEVLFNLSYILVQVAGFIQPFMPSTAAGICQQIRPTSARPPSFSEAASFSFDILPPGSPIGPIQQLFPLERE